MTRSVINQLPKDQSLTSLIYSGARNPVGMFLSIVLLSLGAPFWFNALKNLVNLRSSVAKKEETERTAPGLCPPIQGAESDGKRRMSDGTLLVHVFDGARVPFQGDVLISLFDGAQRRVHWAHTVKP